MHGLTRNALRPEVAGVMPLMNHPRYIVGFFAVLLLMVSGGLDLLAHKASVPTPEPLSLVLFGLAVTVLKRWWQWARRTTVAATAARTESGSPTS